MFVYRGHATIHTDVIFQEIMFISKVLVSGARNTHLNLYSLFRRFPVIFPGNHKVLVSGARSTHLKSYLLFCRFPVTPPPQL